MTASDAPSPLRRRQLTLFAPEEAAAILEPIRQRLDPVQHRLIRAHVTLCREDELAEEPLALMHQLATLPASVTLAFGAPVGFGGHGVLLPCVEGAETFQRLRAVVLGSETIRAHSAHLTLAHPRNARAPGNTDAGHVELAVPFTVTFTTLALIEQVDGGPWLVREVVALGGLSS